MLACCSCRHCYLLYDATQDFRECVIKDSFTAEWTWMCSLFWVSCIQTPQTPYLTEAAACFIRCLLCLLCKGECGRQWGMFLLLFGDTSEVILSICSLVWCTTVKKGCWETVEDPVGMFRHIGCMTCEEGLGELDFSLEKRKLRWLRGNLIVTYIYLKEYRLLSSRRW